MRRRSLRLSGRGGNHALLQLHGAVQRIEGAGELYQHSVSHDFNDSASVMSNYWDQYLASPIFELGQGASLVLLHQQAVTDYVGCQDRGEGALYYPSGEQVASKA